MDSERPVALVTGAGSGIGRATAIRLSADGFRVVLAGRRESALHKTASLLADANCLVAPCDVTQSAEVADCLRAVIAAYGRLDVLVNNAGISRTAAFEDVDLETWREVMSVDVESIVVVTQAALPHLKVTRGNVVNVASLAGLGGDPGMTIYNAAKGAVVNLTRSLAMELAGEGIRVNAVAPTLTFTDATADIPAVDIAAFVQCIPLGRGAAPSEVASVIAFLAGPDASFVTGVVIPIDGGLRASSGQPAHR